MDRKHGLHTFQMSLFSIFLLGLCQEWVFVTPIANAEKLKTGIQAEACIVTEDIIKNTWREIEQRLDIFKKPLFTFSHFHPEIQWGHTLEFTQVCGFTKKYI